MGRILTAAALLATAACGSDTTAPELDGGVLATFDSSGDRFRVWVTRASTIEQILALQAGESEASIPNGPLLRGPGEANHNQPWSWHYDPELVEMAELTIELCDGRPSYVEEHLDTYLDEVGRYCPWGAKLVSVEDLR